MLGWSNCFKISTSAKIHSNSWAERRASLFIILTALLFPLGLCSHSHTSPKEPGVKWLTFTQHLEAFVKLSEVVFSVVADEEFFFNLKIIHVLNNLDVFGGSMVLDSYVKFFRF